MELIHICVICLRTNRKLKNVTSVLSAYHNKITNDSLQLTGNLYCSECECLLRKTYNFHQKCLKSAEILKTWLTETQGPKSTSASTLHTQLPQTNLDTWTPQNSRVFNYNYVGPEDVDAPIVFNEIYLDDHCPKEEVVESTSPSEDIFKIEMHEDHITEESETLFKNVNSESEDITQNNLLISTAGIGETANVKINTTKRDSKSNLSEKVSNTSKITIKLINNQVVLDYEDIVTDSNKNETVIEKLVHHVVSDISKTSNESKSELDSSDKSNEPGDSDVEIITCDDNDSKNNDVIEIEDAIDYSEDASLNSDDGCDDLLNTPTKKRTQQITLDEVADITVSDNDLDDHSLAKNTKTTSKIDEYIDIFTAEKRIDCKILTMGETLDSICENWEVTSLLDVRIPNSNNEIKKFTSQFFQQRKGVDKVDMSKLLKKKNFQISELTKSMSYDLETITKKCKKIVHDYKNGLNVSKVMLKEELMEKFDSWGELKAANGFVFDKDIIMNCLDKVSVQLILHWIKKLRRVHTLTPYAAAVLRKIQNKQSEDQYESIFDIEHLTTKKEILEEFQRRKTYECYVEADFKCELCYQGFKSERLLKYHQKYHDESSGPVSCSICHVRYRSRLLLVKHMAVHRVVYKCKLCPLITNHRNSMISHYEQHNGIVYKCEPCKRTYKSRSTFLSHQMNRHPRSEHDCTICGRGFGSLKGLTTHFARKHLGGPPAPAGEEVTCEVCNKTFASNQALYKHQATIHGDKTPLRGRPRGRGSRVANRVGKRPAVKPATCILCNKVGANYQWLVVHFALEHPGQDIHTAYLETYVHLCHICGKGLKSRRDLHTHMSMKHRAGGYKCPECGKQFPSSMQLRNHQFMHGPRTFCCEQCGKKYRTSSNLYNHMRSHTKERRFECNICGKKFPVRAGVAEHIRGVHDKLPRVRKGAGGRTKRSRSIEPDADYSDRCNPNNKDVGSKTETKGDETALEGETYTNLEVPEKLGDGMELELGAEINL